MDYGVECLFPQKAFHPRTLILLHTYLAVNASRPLLKPWLNSPLFLSHLASQHKPMICFTPRNSRKTCLWDQTDPEQTSMDPEAALTKCLPAGLGRRPRPC